MLIEATETGRTAKEAEAELGSHVLERETGEAIGEYAFHIISDAADADTHFENFDLTLAADAPKYTITAIDITEVESVTSRQAGFDVLTSLTGERQPGVTTRIRVEAVEYPVSADGITFSRELNDYITGASEGIEFSGQGGTISINKAVYQRQRKDTAGDSLTWEGYLPAGMVLSVSIVDGNQNVVSSSPVTITVSPVNVSLCWDSNSYSTGASTGNYVISDNGVTGSLSLAAAAGSAGAGELAELAYRKDGGAETYSYGTLGLNFTPEVSNSGTVHTIQSVRAGIVDTLNLSCEAKTLSFYVDDCAFAIPASSIVFENRGESVSITLPETGTVNSVVIDGGTVAVSKEVGQSFTLPVEWSGENLITAGTAISVTYTDQAGHQGTGAGTVSRSFVVTPITFTIRPELNAAGYLNGSNGTLIISGTACACEPVTVTVAGVSQTIYSTRDTVWSDSNGAWEVMLPVSSLPENESFTISAEYVDVYGTSHSITASYDEYCASAAVLSPVYEAMTHLEGLVEPGTVAALVINGDTLNYYELNVDQYGHFSSDEVPMLFAEEDSFDIYVTDIAGNVSIAHYEIVDCDETTGVVSPLGKFLYTKEETDASGYIVLPVSASDFAVDGEDGENSESLEIPLLMGASWVVGSFTVSRTENGITVSSEIELDETDIDPEVYHIEDVALLVFASEPTARELKDIELARESRDGEKLRSVYASYGNVFEAAYGEEIAFGSSQTVWIMSVQKMTILAEAIEALEHYQYICSDSKESRGQDANGDSYDDLYQSYQEK